MRGVVIDIVCALRPINSGENTDVVLLSKQGSSVWANSVWVNSAWVPSSTYITQQFIYSSYGYYHSPAVTEFCHSAVLDWLKKSLAQAFHEGLSTATPQVWPHTQANERPRYEDKDHQLSITYCLSQLTTVAVLCFACEAFCMDHGCTLVYIYQIAFSCNKWP